MNINLYIGYDINVGNMRLNGKLFYVSFRSYSVSLVLSDSSFLYIVSFTICDGTFLLMTRQKFIWLGMIYITKFVKNKE